MLLPLSHGDDVSDLVKLLLVMPLIDSLVDLFLDLVKVLVDAAHQVFQVLLQLSVVGFFSEGKALHVPHVLSDLVVDRQVGLFNESKLLLNALFVKLRVDVLANC